MQLVIKLMMNSAYGKCGLKPITTDVKYVADDERVNFVHNHFNEIRQFTEMPNGEWRFELYKQSTRTTIGSTWRARFSRSRRTS